MLYTAYPLPPPSGAATTPLVQSVNGLDGVASTIPAGRISVKARSDTGAAEVELSMLKISLLVLPGPMVPGLKILLNNSAFARSGNAKIDYLLESSPACVAATAKYANNKITVQLPESEVSEWALSDNVAITAELPLDGPGTLKLLVEKDFACLSPREGTDSC